MDDNELGMPVPGEQGGTVEGPIAPAAQVGGAQGLSGGGWLMHGAPPGSCAWRATIEARRTRRDPAHQRLLALEDTPSPLRM
jgi:hypothetical protein